jgi:GDP-D-mannose 3',5'-epimerase
LVKIRATCPEPSRRVRGKEFPSEVWGDGTAVRVFTYVDDLVDGIYTLMQSDLEGPVNLGSNERVTVADLVRTVIEVSGKRIKVKYVPGPVGVHARNPSTGSGRRFSKARIRSLDWEAKVSLKEGIACTYPWIKAQVEKLRIANCGLRI